MALTQVKSKTSKWLNKHHVDTELTFSIISILRLMESSLTTATPTYDYLRLLFPSTHWTEHTVFCFVNKLKTPFTVKSMMSETECKTGQTCGSQLLRTTLSSEHISTSWGSSASNWQDSSVSIFYSTFCLIPGFISSWEYVSLSVMFPQNNQLKALIVGNYDSHVLNVFVLGPNYNQHNLNRCVYWSLCITLYSNS